MQDTPEHILQKQFDIIYQKSNYEKLMMSLEMMQLSYDMAYDLIKKQNPMLSHRQIISKRFAMMHGAEFSEEELHRICQHLESV